jgi:SAM-dependent methyltransferase
MEHQHVPWQFKIAAKVVLSRVPVSRRLLNRAGIFKTNAMENPGYATGVFRRHFQNAIFARKAQPFVALELGPGRSVASVVIARAFGASAAYAIDVTPFAANDIGQYRFLELYLREIGLEPPSLAKCSDLNDVMKACNGQYLSNGVESLKSIPTGSVDFIFSHTVLQHVRRKDFVPLLAELRRVQRLDGIGSHTVSITDILGGNLNDLRFSQETWESNFMANSGFYTNRIRYNEFLRLFQEARFVHEVYRTARWENLPTPRTKMAPQFASLPFSELQVSGFDVCISQDRSLTGLGGRTSSRTRSAGVFPLSARWGRSSLYSVSHFLSFRAKSLLCLKYLP